MPASRSVSSGLLRASSEAFGRRIAVRRGQRRFISKTGGLKADNEFFKISEEVRAAVMSKKPVIALETTIYTHGFPYPDNVALASHLESVVRANGCTPATIGVLHGVAHVGMSPDEIIELTSSAGQASTLKLSRRELSYVCGSRLIGKDYSGGTTISATIALAQKANIPILATGGLGGVHRDAATSMDISSDLTVIGRSNVHVISSGCKSFLDIGLTLEYLETQGVGVATFADGREGDVDFPAFWSRESGHRSPLVVQSESHAASMIYAQQRLKLGTGLVFANPIPEKFSIPKDEMEVLIEQAIREADKTGARGKDNTPFVLSKLKELSEGRTVAANRALVEDNVRRGAIMARELSALQKPINVASEGFTAQNQGLDPSVTRKYLDSATTRGGLPTRDGISDSTPTIIVAGATALDLSCDYIQSKITNPMVYPEPLLHTSNPCQMKSSLGGVAHNIALTLTHLGCKANLSSFLAPDAAGQTVISLLRQSQVSDSGIRMVDQASGLRTPQFVAVNRADKDLHLAMADMTLLEELPSSNLDLLVDSIRSSDASYVILDANFTGAQLRRLLDVAKEAGSQTIYEPVSVAKSSRIFNTTESRGQNGTAMQMPTFPSHLIDIVTPNADELAAIHASARSSGHLDSEDWWKIINAFNLPTSGSRALLERSIRSSLSTSFSSTVTIEDSLRNASSTATALLDAGIPQQALQLLPFIPTILTTLGPRGVLLTQLITHHDLAAPTAPETIQPWLLLPPNPAPVPLLPTSAMTAEAGSTIAGVYLRLFLPPQSVPADQIASVNGAGDTFTGAVVAGLSLRKGARVEDVVDIAQEAAALTLRSEGGVSDTVRELRDRLSV